MTPHEHAGHSGHGTGTTGHDTGTQTELPGVHRWVVFGTDRVYLSHLSMSSMAEHAKQVIVQAEFVEPDGSASTAYADDQRKHPKQRLYTLDPENFVLPDILPTDSRPAARKTVKADLYRDHVEKGSPEKELIAAGIDVHIVQVVHVHLYDPHVQPLNALDYVLFGDRSESYLAHFITRAPDFDQILRVSVNGDLNADLLASGSRLTIPNRSNRLSHRLNEGERPVGAVLHGGASDVTMEVRPDVELYCNSDADMQ